MNRRSFDQWFEAAASNYAAACRCGLRPDLAELGTNGAVSTEFETAWRNRFRRVGINEIPALEDGVWALDQTNIEALEKRNKWGQCPKVATRDGQYVPVSEENVRGTANPDAYRTWWAPDWWPHTLPGDRGGSIRCCAGREAPANNGGGRL